MGAYAHINAPFELPKGQLWAVHSFNVQGKMQFAARMLNAQGALTSTTGPLSESTPNGIAVSTATMAGKNLAFVRLNDASKGAKQFFVATPGPGNWITGDSLPEAIHGQLSPVSPALPSPGGALFPLSRFLSTKTWDLVLVKVSDTAKVLSTTVVPLSTEYLRSAQKLPNGNIRLLLQDSTPTKFVVRELCWQ